MNAFQAWSFILFVLTASLCVHKSNKISQAIASLSSFKNCKVSRLPKDIPGTGGMADDDRMLVMTTVLIVAEDYNLCLYAYTLSHSFLAVILLFLRSCVPSPYSIS